MTESNKKKLNSFFDQFSNHDHVLVVINADPDSISSAMAVKRLLWHRVSEVKITTINRVKRSDNISMIRLLGVDQEHFSHIDMNQYTRFVIVDSQPDHHESFTLFKPDVIIDHHPITSEIGKFNDIRPEYGATATILTEYLRAAGIRPSIKLATGLFYGIKTDTNNFIKKTVMKDIRAFQFLYKYANIHLIQRIESTEIRPDFLKYFLKSLGSKKLRQGRMFVHLGKVTSPDACVLIADFYIRVKSVEWSIISGIHKNKLIIIFRNFGIQKNAGKAAKTAFGRLGPSGGHKNAARSEIELKAIKKYVDYENEKNLLNWIIARVKGTKKSRV